MKKMNEGNADKCRRPVGLENYKLATIKDWYV